MKSVTVGGTGGLLVIMAMFTIITQATCLNLTQYSNATDVKSCTTKFGLDGKCVKFWHCDENNTISTGGIIIDEELRENSCPYGDICCSDKKVIKSHSTAEDRFNSGTSSNCIVTDQNDCPWCVKLYRGGIDLNRLPSGFFCMGTLISNRVVLTTATCLYQAMYEEMWAQISSAPNPNTNYTVKFRLAHPNYNSGTRNNDLALLTIEPELQWDNSGPKGACIRFESKSLIDNCVAAGIDDDENIKMTSLLVQEGNCGSGAKSDAACGFVVGNGCYIIAGAPVMCRVNNGPLMVSGVAKFPCRKDPLQALLSNLVQAGQWINNNLKGMGLTETDYLRLTN